ncbi:hypothetical protein BJY01DRAFT_255109 [Aspergillus pseudoustus]|uniref:Uncharacterized protein n=1 Tax=Aspergillus pseudoustus TaxID=1810923 RepID=A0ABR4IQF1_9EURO
MALVQYAPPEVVVQLPQTLDLYIAFGRHPHRQCQQHWLLIVTPADSTLGTYYSVYAQDNLYTHAIEPGQSLHTSRIESTGKLATIPFTAGTVLDDIARTTAPQRCPLYIVAVLWELEFVGIIAPGIASFYGSIVPPSMVEWAVREKGMDHVTAVATSFDALKYARSLGLGNLEFDTCFF